MEKIGYHYTIFDSKTNEIVCEFDEEGADKNYCQKMMLLELNRRNLIKARDNCEIKIKGERYNVEKRNVKMVMSQYGYNIKGLSERFLIPYRTVQNWVGGQRECPDYVIRMMDEILSKEKKEN